MKLIIDIPEEIKQTFDNAKNEDLYGNYYDRNSLIGKAIQNGTPLDDLRAELGRCKTWHEMKIAERDTKSKLLISDIFCHVVAIIDGYTTEKAERSE